MTKKQEDILFAALMLFSEEGFHATSTYNVAQKAGVSEGLIFRHFTNKEGLLKALITDGEIHSLKQFDEILKEQDSKEVLKKIILLPTELKDNEEDYKTWKLSYKLKWEFDDYGEQLFNPIQHKIKEAFTDLRYKDPEQETTLLLTSLDGILTKLFLQKAVDLNLITQYLINKYGL